jgi:perosamine synthetase
VAEDVCARQICLPVHSDMTSEEARYVAASLRRTIQTLPANPPARTASR